MSEEMTQEQTSAVCPFGCFQLSSKDVYHSLNKRILINSQLMTRKLLACFTKLLTYTAQSLEPMNFISKVRSITSPC